LTSPRHEGFESRRHIVAQAPKADLDFDDGASLRVIHLKRFGDEGVQLREYAQRRARSGGFGRDRASPNMLETIRQDLEKRADGGGSLDSFSIRQSEAGV